MSLFKSFSWLSQRFDLKCKVVSLSSELRYLHLEMCVVGVSFTYLAYLFLCNSNCFNLRLNLLLLKGAPVSHQHLHTTRSYYRLDYNIEGRAYSLRVDHLRSMCKAPSLVLGLHRFLFLEEIFTGKASFSRRRSMPVKWVASCPLDLLTGFLCTPLHSLSVGQSRSYSASCLPSVL